VADIERRLNAAFRIDLAEDWDNVGLLIGRRSRMVRRLMICLDLTEPVLREAFARRAQMILAYHPPIFDPLKRILLEDQPVVYQAAATETAVYALHTAYDMIPGGTSDALADLIDLQDRQPIQPSTVSGQSKLVVFVPQDHADAVAAAVFDAGGGVIGDYRCCSFRTPGEGTFLGGETSDPAVGQAGVFERVPELRMEILVDNARLSEAIRRVKQAHPYEEVAYDVCPLSQVQTDCGLGRIGRLPKPMAFDALVARIKRRTGLRRVLTVTPSPSEPIVTAAVCPGSCGKLAAQLAGKVDLYLTGELRHHDALALQAAGAHVVCLGHGNSERPALKQLAKQVTDVLPDLEVFLSDRDADPLVIA